MIIRHIINDLDAYIGQSATRGLQVRAAKDQLFEALSLRGFNQSQAGICQLKAH